MKTVPEWPHKTCRLKTFLKRKRDLDRFLKFAQYSTSLESFKPLSRFLYFFNILNCNKFNLPSAGLR